ncbi:MAG: hypothetical protein V2A78_10625 [bacterium]
MKKRLLCWVIIILSILFIVPSVNCAGPIKSKAKITCFPKTLYQGDMLTLKMETLHGGYLGICTPDGKFFFVVCPHPGDGRNSLVPSEEFTNMSELKIITNVTKAALWEYGHGMELIFTKSGNYEILLSDNLETDDGTPVYKCNVKYIDRHKK